MQDSNLINFQIKLQTDVDQLNANVTTLSEAVEENKNKITEKIIEEKDAREEETEALKKGIFMNHLNCFNRQINQILRGWRREARS